MRELREFRVHHPEFIAAGVQLAGVSRDTVASNRAWSDRLALPYPVLADVDGAVGRAFGVLRSIRLGPWTIEFLRRSTLLAGPDGRIAAVWPDVKVRGHARQVLDAARGLSGRGSGLPAVDAPRPIGPEPESSDIAGGSKRADRHRTD